MKLLMTLCLMGFLSGSLEAREVVLNQAELEIGELAQEHGEKAGEVITFIRTHQTPERVEISLNFNTRRLVCTESDVQCTHHPARYISCGSIDNRYGNQDCGGWSEPTTTCDTVCVSHDYIYSEKQKKYHFKFKDVLDLSPGEQEVYEVEFQQKSFSWGTMKESAKIIESKGDYSIRDWIFRNGATIKGE